MEDCPPDDELIAFALGKLSEARLPAFHTHLDDCPTCQRVLAEAARAVATAATASMSDDMDWNTTFRRGTLVADRYVISRFIARGAMGEVYEAYDRELAERVALKTVASTVSDNARAVRRLRAEAQLARRVSHPNVCRIYDFGTHVMPDGGGQIHFLTMEFVEGETLGQRVRLGGALPLAEALETARELLQALRAAHGASVLHRDFKSDNVMLKWGDAERASAIVLDFGLARAVDHQPAVSGSRPTFVGTFGYMAPELLEGMPHSTASDVYAFGVVWFEMLTGQLPFEGAATPALALKCLQSPAPAPSSINTSIPRELDTLVLGCLERSPAARFRTVKEVLLALDALGAAAISSSFRPVSASTATRGDGGRSTLALPAWVIGTAVALAALAIVVAVWLARPRVDGRALQAQHAIPSDMPPATEAPAPQPTRLALVPPPAPSASASGEAPRVAVHDSAPARTATNVHASHPSPTALRPPPAPANTPAPTPTVTASTSATPPASSSASVVGAPAPRRRPNWIDPFEPKAAASGLTGAPRP
jgi:tRNA A-37 threonylcarbamoyl transferase component Bud32